MLLLIRILSQELLDNSLVVCDGSIVTLAGTIHPCVISEQMEQLVLHNFQVLQEFEQKLSVSVKGDFEKNSIIESVLNHFGERFKKVSSISSSINWSIIESRNS